MKTESDAGPWAAGHRGRAVRPGRVRQIDAATARLSVHRHSARAQPACSVPPLRRPQPRLLRMEDLNAVREILPDKEFALSW